MSTVDVVRLIATREVEERLRSKPFMASAALTLLMVVLVATLPALTRDDGPRSYDVAVDDAGLTARLDAAASTLEDTVELHVRTVDSRDAGEALVRAGDVDAALVDDEIVVDRDLDDELAYLAQTALRREPVPEPATVRALDPPDEDEDARGGLIFVGTLLLYSQLFGFGYWVAAGVVEEKASRVIELLLAKARPRTILTGKILGIGALAFVQLVVFMTVGLTAATVSGTVDLPPGIVGVAAQVLGWFVLGFALYSCLFAAGGALASRVEELQSTTAPLSIVATASFFAAIAAAADPAGTVARIATFVPPSAPLIVPIRVAAGEIAAWEVLLAVAAVLVAIVGAVRLAGLAYTRGALHVRGQLRLRDALARAR